MKGFFTPFSAMATNTKDGNLLSKIESIQGKLNSFATLVNDRISEPEFKATLDAVMKEFDELKAAAGGKVEPANAPAQ